MINSKETIYFVLSTVDYALHLWYSMRDDELSKTEDFISSNLHNEFLYDICLERYCSENSIHLQINGVLHFMIRKSYRF